MFWKFEKHEKETKIDKEKYPVQFRLKNWGILLEEDPC